MLNIDLDLERVALSYLVSPHMTINILLKSKIDPKVFSDKDHSLISKVLIPNLGKKKELVKSLLQKVSTGPEHFKTLRRLYDVSQKEIDKFNPKDFYDVVDRLKELLVLREVEKLLENTVRDDMPSGDAKKCLENLSKGLFKIRQGTRFEDIERKDISEIASLQTEKLDMKVESIPSGIESIDRVVGGWRFGDLIIVGSKSSGGKSCFLMNFGSAAYRAGFNVCYITIEMTLEQFHERYVSIVI